MNCFDRLVLHLKFVSFTKLFLSTGAILRIIQNLQLKTSMWAYHTVSDSFSTFLMLAKLLFLSDLWTCLRNIDSIMLTVLCEAYWCPFVGLQADGSYQTQTLCVLVVATFRTQEVYRLLPTMGTNTTRVCTGTEQPRTHHHTCPAIIITTPTTVAITQVTRHHLNHVSAIATDHCAFCIKRTN